MITITDEEFRLLRDFIASRSGIFYNERQKYIFQQKILKRLEKNNLKTFREYYYLLKYGGIDYELQNLYDTLTVNETYFFREQEQLVTVCKLIPIIKKPKINILCAGCSSGEEPYTLAMLLREISPASYDKLNILGVDLSNKALALAKSGNYRKISLTFRSIEQRYIYKYFSDLGESYELKEIIKNSTKFKSLNLKNLAELRMLGSFDFIFCRNVMIYFAKDFKTSLVDGFYKMLQPDGFLITSSTENLNDIESDFRIEKVNNCFLYKKDKN